MSSGNSRSENAPPSPLTFARAWQEYRAASARTPFPDSRLLLAARFWRANSQALHAPAFTTYVQEDLPPLVALIDKGLPGDLLPDELEEVAALLTEVASTQSEPAPCSRRVWEEAARGWFYVGEVERAGRALAQAGLLSDSDIPGRAEIIAVSDRSDAPEIPGLLADHCTVSHPELAQWLQRFSTSWQARRETGDPRRAHCLLVEYDTQGRPVRGRVRTLQGTLSPLPSDAEADEVVFHHQVRTPDDPFVGTAYSALAALRSACAGTRARGGVRAREAGGQRYRATLSLGGGNEEVYSGNSIGLAAFAVAYADHRAGELHRDRRTIADTVAFTGGVNDRGEAQPISGESLAVKIKRAFHSPLEYVVVPETNRREAEDYATDLRKDHPRRRLHIIGVEDTADLIADHNILRTEKLCVGEFTIRAAARLSRNVKVQVPVLLLMLYALVCVIEPRAWILFDWNPSSVELTTSGFHVLNEDGHEVWEKTFDCLCDSARSTWTVGNIDHDDRNEVAFMLKADESSLCSLNAVLFVYDDDDELLFQRNGVILGEYPGDTILEQPYSPGRIDFIRRGDERMIMTRVMRSNPARAQIRVWNASGTPLGWYINQGFTADHMPLVYSPDSSEVYFLVYNNQIRGRDGRQGCVAFFSLPIDSCHGVSPPYQDPELDLSAVSRGNQTTYILLPPSDLNMAGLLAYNHPWRLRVAPGDEITAITLEYVNPTGEIWYHLNPDLRAYDVEPGDTYYSARKRYADEGKLPPVDDWLLHRSDLLKSVRYWSDSGWVTEGQLQAAPDSK